MVTRRGGAVTLAVTGLLLLACSASADVNVAVLPPAGLEACSDAFRAAAEDAGLKLSALTPEQLVAPDTLTVAHYPVAALFDADEYLATVAEAGDGAQALLQYVQGGGALLVLSGGSALSRPLRRVENGWETEPSPVRRVNLLVNLGLLDAGQTLYGGTPAGAALQVTVPSALAGRVPAALDLPTGGEPFRFLPTEQLSHIEILPLASLVSGDRDYGTPLALALNRKLAEAGPVVYGWSPLVGPKLAADLLAGLAGYRAEVARLAAEEEAKYAGAAVKDGDAAWLGDAQPVVALQFNKGVVYLELWPDVAPKHCESFAKLIGERFYDGVFVHRVEPGFVMQTGDPNTKKHGGPQGPDVGMGGPGYSVPAEFSNRPHLKGTLSMARSSDPNSAGSQFFICLDRAAHLDNQYSVFGKVLGDGMDIVDRLQVGDRIVHGWVVKPTTP